MSPLSSERNLGIWRHAALAVVLLVSVLGLQRCTATPAPAGPAATYSHLHFTAGYCQADGKEGQGVIDLRNGNLYCVPYDGSAAIAKGALNLASIP